VIRLEFKALAVGLLLAFSPAESQAGDGLDHQLDSLKRQLVETARQSQAHEERVTGIETRLLELSRREAELGAELSGRKADQAATLGALMRLSRQPPQALIATRTTIDDAIRTSLLLATTASLLDDEARRLGAALDELAALHRRIASRRMELEGASAGLAEERVRLEALLESAAARRREAHEQPAGTAALTASRTARLADEAETLTDLSGAVLALSEGDAARFRPGRPFSAARGSLPMPARGRLVGLFGEGGGERKNKGIIIETRDDAQVITPYDGEVVFVGPFRGYGRLLIIDHGEGYHTLLAGFSRIDSIQGQWLLAGEPVGVMGRGLTDYKTLYVEFRHDGVAINPLPWLAASEIKADG
jgi:septal ring factor EnvC (AmiA/AmiB activator)